MTDMIKADGVVLKTDQLGRMQTPVERREQILDEFERSGLSGKKFAALVGIKYPTLATWAAKRRRERGTPSMVTGVLAGGYVQVDETPIEYLAPGNGQTKQGYFWTVNRPGGDGFFHWQTSRAARCLENLIPLTFTGTLQCDAYSAYPSFANGRGPAIELAGCWAHVRRKFYEALEQSPRVSGWLLRQIQNLYRMEANLREHRAGPRLRQAMRAGQSRPIVERFQRALIRLKSSGRYLPQSLLGQAMDYALGQWPTLEVFLKDGRIEIDNNLVENAIRPTAIGKKNWLFIGDAEAGQRSAIIYTVIENCRRRNLDPFAYLRDVLTRLPNLTNWQIPEVTPKAWAKAQLPLQRQTTS